MITPPDLAALPKAELHVHLEGTVRPSTLEEFAAREGVTIPKSFDSLESFVQVYMSSWQTMTSPAGYARLALNSVESSFAPEELKAELRAAIAEWRNKA